MSKSNNASAWTEAGYLLFAEQGIDGIHVEKLARIVQRNKSGFYHYFGDLEVYYAELLRLHEQKSAQFLAEISQVKNIDPEYLQIVVKYKVSTMFQVHLLRCKHLPAFYNVAEEIDEKESVIVGELWSDYLGFCDNPELAIRYFIIVRDMFYTRASQQNLTYEFVRDLAIEAREVMRQITESNTTQETEQ